MRTAERMLRPPAPTQPVPHPQWESGSLREVAKPIENYISWSSESFYPEELIDLRGSLPPYLARTAEVPPGATAEIVQIFTWGAQTRAVCTDQTGRNLSLLVHSPIKYKYLVKKKAMSKPMMLPEILKKFPNLPLVIYPSDEDWTNSAQCKCIESLAIRNIVDERFLVCGKLVRGDQGLIRCLFTIPESLRVRLVTAEGLVQNPHYSAIDWEALLAQLMHVGQSLRLNASLLETALIRELPSALAVGPENQGLTPQDVLADGTAAPDPIPVGPVRPSGPLPPPPPPSIPPDAELPDESFHYYTLNGIVRDALRAALRAAHNEGKLTPDVTLDRVVPAPNTAIAKVPARLPNHIAITAAPPPWAQSNQSKRASVSSDGGTQAPVPRPEQNHSQSQLQMPTLGQRSRSPFRNGNRSKSPFRNGASKTSAVTNVGQRSNTGQRPQELVPRSLESSQRSLDSGYRSLDSRGRSPVPQRSPATVTTATQLSGSSRALYARHLSHPINPAPVQNRATLSHSSSWPDQYATSLTSASVYNGHHHSNGQSIDHYSPSIENLSLNEKKGGARSVIHVKGDSPNHYMYTDSLPITDDGYLSPREIRQGMPSPEYQTNIEVVQNNSHTYDHEASRTIPTKLVRQRSVSTLDQIPADLSQLTVEDIGQVLKLLNLEHHKQKFQQNMIDGAMLMDLAADDLHDLGLSRVECTRLNKFVRDGWRPKLT